MKTSFALLAILGLLAAIGCNGENTTEDSAVVIEAGPGDTGRPDVTVDTGMADSGTTTDVADTGTVTDTGSDAGNDAPSDGGGSYVDGCFVGTPTLMTDFLNRCGGAVAFPARAARGGRLLPDGGVQPLPM